MTIIMRHLRLRYAVARCVESRWWRAHSSGSRLRRQVGWVRVHALFLIGGWRVASHHMLCGCGWVEWGCGVRGGLKRWLVRRLHGRAHREAGREDPVARVASRLFVWRSRTPYLSISFQSASVPRARGASEPWIYLYFNNQSDTQSVSALLKIGTHLLGPGSSLPGPCPRPPPLPSPPTSVS